MSVKTKALSEKLSRLARVQPVSIQKDAPVSAALQAMRERQTPCLMVCDGPRLTGVFTERDFIMKVAGRAGAGDPVSKHMTPDPIVAKLGDTVGDAVEVMVEKGLRQLPIVDDSGAPASVVTADAVIQYLASAFPAAVVNRPPEPHVKAAEPDGA